MELARAVRLPRTAAAAHKIFNFRSGIFQYQKRKFLGELSTARRHVRGLVAESN